MHKNKDENSSRHSNRKDNTDVKKINRTNSQLAVCLQLGTLFYAFTYYLSVRGNRKLRSWFKVVVHAKMW